MSMCNAYAVEADDVQGGGEGECAVSVPGGGQNPVPSGCLESFRNVALALVDDDLAVIVDVSEHIIAGNRVTFVAQGVSADGLFAEDEGLLLVDLECLRTFPPGGFLVLLCGGGVLVPMPLEDGQVLAQVLPHQDAVRYQTVFFESMPEQEFSDAVGICFELRVDAHDIVDKASVSRAPFCAGWPRFCPLPLPS